MRLISVVMGTASEEARAIETQKLLTYGFRYFESHKLYDANQVLTSLPVYAGERDSVDLAIQEEVYVTIPRGQAEAMTAAVDVDEIIQAPVQESQVMGIVNVMLGNEMIYSGDVVAVQEVVEGGAFKRFVDWISLMFNDSFSE
jgi:D-alanyl-D-alanine carboxypeptidase (penicillin-binding protein 5/6)